MPSYLLELYLPGGDPLEPASEAARRVVDEAARRGSELRYVRTLLVAEDETCFHVFESPSRQALVDAAERAGFRDVRVTEAVETGDA